MTRISFAMRLSGIPVSYTHLVCYDEVYYHITEDETEIVMYEYNPEPSQNVYVIQMKEMCIRDSCGTYLVQNDYDEMMDRLYILEDIKDGRIDTAELKIVRYGSRYKDIPVSYTHLDVYKRQL